MNVSKFYSKISRKYKNAFQKLNFFDFLFFWGILSLFSNVKLQLIFRKKSVMRLFSVEYKIFYKTRLSEMFGIFDFFGSFWEMVVPRKVQRFLSKGVPHSFMVHLEL